MSMEKISPPLFNERQIVLMIAIVASLGGLLFGFDTGVISGALGFMKHDFALSTFAEEKIVSFVILGALTGALLSGLLTNRYGRKRMLLVTSILFIAGTIVVTLAETVDTLIMGRFIVGMGIGISSYIVPLFISEVAPANRRGSLVLLNGIAITGGEAIAFLVDYFLTPSHAWRTMFAVGLIPAVLLFFGAILLPYSPRWLLLRGLTDKARQVMKQIRRPNEVEAEIKEIQDSLVVEGGRFRTLFSRKMLPILVIGLGLGILQQFVGINTIMYYGPVIFKTAGFQGPQTVIMATFVMGLVNTVMTFVTFLLVDRVGRRRLLLVGLSVAAVSLAVVGYVFQGHHEGPIWHWLCFIFTMTYIMGYCVSVGSLFWLIIAEIYPLRVRSLAMSVVTAAQWAANFLVALTFLTIVDTFGAADTFWLYGVMCLIALVFCYYWVPETKNLSLEKIEEHFAKE